MNNLIELKAHAYDLLAQVEFLQKQLQQVNSQIASLMKLEAEKQKAEKE